MNRTPDLGFSQSCLVWAGCRCKRCVRTVRLQIGTAPAVPTITSPWRRSSTSARHNGRRKNADLLFLEGISVEELLQLLVGEVDAKLLCVSVCGVDSK